MDYKNLTNKNFASFTATSEDFNYATSYYYDEKGAITELSVQVTKVSDNSYVGSISIADNGQQCVNINGGSDLATNITNFETIVTKIKADVATVIAATASATTSEAAAS
jgi:hypothetical protein